MVEWVGLEGCRRCVSSLSRARFVSGIGRSIFALIGETTSKVWWWTDGRFEFVDSCGVDVRGPDRGRADCGGCLLGTDSEGPRISHRRGGNRGDPVRGHDRAAARANRTLRLADLGWRRRGVRAPRTGGPDRVDRRSALGLPRGVVPPALRIVRLPVALGRSGIRNVACALPGEHVRLREVPPGSPRQVAFHGGPRRAGSRSGTLAGEGTPLTWLQTTRPLRDHREARLQGVTIEGERLTKVAVLHEHERRAVCKGPTLVGPLDEELPGRREVGFVVTLLRDTSRSRR